MLLIGQFDSPFVRRVGVTLKLYDLAFEHSPLSTFGDPEKIARYSPLVRVPTLVLEDGRAFTDSGVILSVIDALVGAPRAMLARSGPDNLEQLRLIGFAAGAAEKAVSLVYERALRETASTVWVRRCQGQINGVLDLLESARAGGTSRWLFDDQLSHADVLIGTFLRFLSEALPGQFDMNTRPALADHSERCEALPAFQQVYQAFHVAPLK